MEFSVFRLGRRQQPLSSILVIKIVSSLNDWGIIAPNLKDGPRAVREVLDRLAKGLPCLVLLGLLAMPRPRNDIRKRFERSVSPPKIGRVEGKLLGRRDHR